tara:strand:+ start:71 stop:292 length:222 start_codon:yes stop_codon:yes gene_type:complete
MGKKAPINVEVVSRRNESFDRLLRRFIKKVKKENIVEDCRNRIYYEKPTDKRARLKKKRKAILDRLKQQEETN